jgi:hypothetical protein
MRPLPVDDPWLVGRFIDRRNGQELDEELGMWTASHMTAHRKYSDDDYTLYWLALFVSLRNARRLELSDLMDARHAAARERFA